MNIKNIYIAGAGGMLGEAFYNVFKIKYNLKCTDKLPNDNWQSKLDFSNFDNYLEDVKNFDTDFLIHLGAMTNLEQCEKEPEITYLNNTIIIKATI